MPPRADDAAHGEEGTASVELVAVVPFLLLAMLAVAQIALAGQALWAASVGLPPPPPPPPPAALPPSLQAAAKVENEEGVRVRVEVPRLIPSLPPLRVGATSSLEGDDG
jgi:hypothetical protein